MNRLDLHENIIKEILFEDKTIRETAKLLKIPKSTVHHIIHSEISRHYPKQYKQICKILEHHFNTKHINGGKSTAERYRKIRKERRN